MVVSQNARKSWVTEYIVLIN